MAFRAADGVIQCVLANAVVGFAVFSTTLKYFVKKYLTSITNIV